MSDKDIESQLETLVDSVGLEKVLLTLVEVCNGKAEHLRTNWQDNEAAKWWERAATMLAHTANTPNIQRVSP